MELFFHFPVVLIGLVGWSATNLLILNAQRFNTSQKRALFMGAWGIWMFPAFNILVLQGKLASDLAVQYCGGITIVLMVLMFLSGLRWRTRP